MGQPITDLSQSDFQFDLLVNECLHPGHLGTLHQKELAADTLGLASKSGRELLPAFLSVANSQPHLEPGVKK